jgi:hypothetical protein
MGSVVLHINLEPELAKKVEALAKRLGLPKSRLVDILLHFELRYEEGNKEAFRVLRQVIGEGSKDER